MIKYKVWSTKIEKVEIERETAQTVFYVSDRGQMVSERKQSSYYNYFDTFFEAQNFILTELNTKIESLEAQIDDNKNRKEKVFLLEDK